MNLYITARKTPSCWVFDHEHQNTVDEALCNGTESVIDWYHEITEGKLPQNGDQLDFYLNTEKFEDALTQIHLIENTGTGSYYKDQFSGMQLWLCPWLQGYFGHVPARLYVGCYSTPKSISDEELDEIMSLYGGTD